MRRRILAAATLTLLIAGASATLAVGEKASAELKAVDGRDIGSVRIVETTAGVLLKIKLKGLAPGVHGFHIHEAGKCEGDFSSSGNIYNPLGAHHGYLNDEGPMVGDLPNLFVGPTGEVDVEMISPFVTLNKTAEESIFDADGTSFVVFEKADDYVTEPDGAAGARVACGVLVPGK
jgi:superoxide dismutase, Cu-Zn family